MLLKSSITGIRIHTDEWHQARLAKFTSSKKHHLMGKSIETDGCLSYIYDLVGEEMTGTPANADIDTPATRHGNLYEPEAIQKFSEKMNVKFAVTQCLISPKDSRFSGTPDAIIPLQETETSYSVRTAEIKCPPTYSAYIGLFLCNTPKDVLKENKIYYWQVIDQMNLCGALIGYLVIYHPFFRSGNLKVIEFNAMHLQEEFKLLKARNKEAEEYFIRVRDKLLAA
jgi:hypothetical protein